MQTLLSALMTSIPSNRSKSRGFHHITSTSIMAVLLADMWILIVPLRQQAFVAPVNAVTAMSCSDPERHNFALKMDHDHQESRQAEHGSLSTCKVMICCTEFTCCLGSRLVLTSWPQLHFLNIFWSGGQSCGTDSNMHKLSSVSSYNPLWSDWDYCTYSMW